MATWRWESQVRDHELDVQGVVNHAHYIHYLEQCRNNFCRNKGVDFVDFHHQGLDLVVVGLEIRYHAPLTAEDHYCVTAELASFKGVRAIFHQTIEHLPSKRKIVSANVTATCINRRTRRPCMPEALKLALSPSK